MAVTLTTPIPQEDITQQGISGFRFEIPHLRNAGNTAMEVAKASVYVSMDLISYDADGNVTKRQTVTEKFPDWPAAFITEVNAVRTRLIALAEARGLIGTGTGEDL